MSNIKLQYIIDGKEFNTVQEATLFEILSDDTDATNRFWLSSSDKEKVAIYLASKINFTIIQKLHPPMEAIKESDTAAIDNNGIPF